MEKVLFNDGWTVKKQGDSHEFGLTWNAVTLPHDAVIGTKRNSEQFNGTKKGFFENGAWEYVKVFSAPEDWTGKDVYVEFEGVQNHALVYVNGNYVGSHAYGYTEFTFNIAKYLVCGKMNVLKVVCKTGDDSRWYTGAGIYRDVHLIVADKFHIEQGGVKITTVAATKDFAQIRANIRLSLTDIAEARIEIFNGDVIVASEKKDVVFQDVTFGLRIKNPKLWSAQEPNLYSYKVTLVQDGREVDCECGKFGIRTLSVNAKEGLKVNGESVKLRGACIHHDNGVIGVRTYRAAEYRRIRKLKEAGFNAIRSAHHPASRYMLDACDELGMYVMDETFDVWQIPKSADDYANNFDDNWRADVAAMVDKDYNRPSVIMYSIGNEISDLAHSAGVEFAHTIAAEVKRLDNTRFTTLAINGILLLMQKMELSAQISGEVKTERKKDINETMNSLDDAMLRVNNAPVMDNIIAGGCDAVDIAGYNYMHNRYLPDMEKYPDRVIVGSETYTKYIADMWAHIQAHNNVIGDFTWTGWDYIGETGIGTVSYIERDYHDGFYAGYPCITAACGDIDITGFRLPQSYYREIVFGLRHEPYIAVHNPAKVGKTEHLSTWGWGDVTSFWDYRGYENAPLTVDVYAPQGEVELYLKGESVGKKICDKKYKCTFTVPYQSGELKAVRRVDGKEYAYSIVTPADECLLSVSCENENVKTGGLAFVDIAITDKKGHVRYGKDVCVTLDVSGGELLGFGSGNPFTEESYADSEHTTFNGRAFAIILATEKEITVKAQAGDLRKSIEISVSQGKENI